MFVSFSPFFVGHIQSNLSGYLIRFLFIYPNIPASLLLSRYFYYFLSVFLFFCIFIHVILISNICIRLKWKFAVVFLAFRLFLATLHFFFMLIGRHFIVSKWMFIYTYWSTNIALFFVIAELNMGINKYKYKEIFFLLMIWCLSHITLSMMSLFLLLFQIIESEVSILKRSIDWFLNFFLFNHQLFTYMQNTSFTKLRQICE